MTRPAGVAKSFVVLVALLALGACSVVDEKRMAYLQAESLPPLKIPAGLDQPDYSKALLVPEVELNEAPNIEPPPLPAE